MAQKKPTELSPRNVQMALMVASGIGTMEIARHFDMTAQNVCIIKRSELFQLEVKRLQANLPDMTQIMKARLDNVAEMGLDKLEELMQISAKDDLQLLKLQGTHAQELLAKAGFGSNQTINMNQQVAKGNILSPEEQELIREQSRALRASTDAA